MKSFRSVPTVVLVSTLAALGSLPSIASADPAAPAAADAAPADASPVPHGPFVEVNLAPFVFGGWSGFGGYAHGHFQVGAGLYSFKLPDFIRDSGFDGASGLDIKSQLGIGMFGRYFLSDRGAGFYGAVQLGWERFGVTNPSSGDSNKIYETYINPYVGYLWKPWHHGFFINPNVGVAFSTSTSGTFALDGQSYKFKGYVPLAFFQVGYVFE